MKKATAVEKAAGSLVVTGGMTMAAAVAGGPLAALLPVLSGSLASNRQLKRVEKAVEKIESEISVLGNDINEISDAQYKYINEALITVMHTPSEEKIEFLVRGVRTAVTDKELTLHKATIIARALHGITVEELRFMLRTIEKNIVFHEQSDGSAYYSVSKTDAEGQFAIGLVNLGLLTLEKDGVWSDDGAYTYTPLAKILVDYISEPE